MAILALKQYGGQLKAIFFFTGKFLFAYRTEFLIFFSKECVNLKKNYIEMALVFVSLQISWSIVE